MQRRLNEAVRCHGSEEDLIWVVEAERSEIDEQVVLVRQAKRDMVYLFFFQAEDGIRDLTVTGVQTCALPIYCGKVRRRKWWGSRPCQEDLCRPRECRGAGRDMFQRRFPRRLFSLARGRDRA